MVCERKAAPQKPAMRIAMRPAGAALYVLIVASHFCMAFDRPVDAELTGTWVLNLEESEDPDRKIEKAIRSAGGRPDSDGKSGRRRYAGGPPEQEIYDHLIYDETIRIAHEGAEIHIVYKDGFERRFYTDGRSRTVSASGSSSGDAQDFSFGGWAGNTLNVEAKPRDGGWTRESYALDPGGRRLRVTLVLKPLLFPAEVEALLVFDRAPVQAR